MSVGNKASFCILLVDRGLVEVAVDDALPLPKTPICPDVRSYKYTSVRRVNSTNGI
jgi:hypothetical protein